MNKLAVLLAVTVSGPALAQGQLPTDVVPISYDINVRPDAQTLLFSGSETVTVQVRHATRTITLNAADLDIIGATFDGRAARVSVDKEAQRVTLRLPRAAKVGRHSLSMQWTGKINRSASGLFAIDYTKADGSPVRMLATQFEAPDARRFAPMWDEPAFKARFRLSAEAPAGQLAFSNMPATSVTSIAGGKQLYKFGETPVMSSYLLFLGMGDLERKTQRAGTVEMGIISRKGVVGQGDYALGAAAKLLPYYNDYFGQPYPMPKMDHIAGPGSSQFFGAMENWGAIFYFESELLFDPARATESNRQRIYTVVAHEMAHQWFGNLVTMRWWDDLWLNEGFASWMEGKASNKFNPSWDSHAAAVIGEREGAMGTDATAATHPIIRKIASVEQIGEAFDGITYAKGQQVIGMLEAYLGEVPFRAGVRRYMAKYKYGNTVTDQLWTELEAASGKPVTAIAHSFTLQGGVPLVSVADVRCTGGKTTASVSQGRFGLDEASKAAQTWQVPVTFGMVGGKSPGERTDAIVSGPAARPVSLTGCGTLVANLGKQSYARVLYDRPAHDALVRDFTRMTLEDRLGLLGDDFALAMGGYQDLARSFETADRVQTGAHPLEWQAVAGEMGTLTGFFSGTPLEAPLRARAIARLSPVLARVGYEPKAGETAPTSNLRETLVGRLGANGDADVAARARRYVAQLAGNPTAIPPAIRAPILSTYATNATAAEWETLLALTKAETNPVAKNRFVVLLGGARDPALNQRALDLLRTDTITAPQKASLLRAIANRNPDLAFDWAVANRDLVEAFLEESTRSGYIVGLGAGSNDPAMPGKIQRYADQYIKESDRGGVRRALTTIAVRKAAADRIRPAVEAWLAGGR
ncbi:M1 family metallopeptidase [Sphingomonas cynarae]|uniref:Aminopeptidase n=1 Tax=Sphingomonas cynarae TaxID=930197 RepID=A0ABP7E2G8_9SPHN